MRCRPEPGLARLMMRAGLLGARAGLPGAITGRLGARVLGPAVRYGVRGAASAAAEGAGAAVRRSFRRRFRRRRRVCRSFAIPICRLRVAARRLRRLCAATAW